MSFPSSSSMRDVIVVGGGPAGSTAARRLALAGKKVLLIEKARFPRYKSCGGAMTEGVAGLLDFDLLPVVERTARKVVFSYKGKALMPAKGADDITISMVMRSSFDHLLLKKAKEAGAEVLEGEQLVSLSTDSKGVTVKARSGASFSGKVCIGADGAASRVAALSGLSPLQPPGMGLAAEVQIPGERCFSSLEETVVFDFGGIESGYRWIFPKAGQHSIGVCTTGSEKNNLKDNLNSYVARCRLLRGSKIVTMKGHPLPFFRGGRRLEAGRVLLVGDAAGLVDPLTGEGIMPAVKSALIAARCVEDFLDGRAALEAYTDTVAAEIIEDFHYAALFAGFFFHRPWTGYAAGVASRMVGKLLADVVMGRGTYERAYQTLRATFIAGLARWIVDRAPKEKDRTPALRAS